MEVTLSPRARSVVFWIAVALGVVILVRAGHALTPFIWAIITAYILHPLVALLQRKTRLPKHLITGWLYVLIGLLLAIGFINLAPLLAQQVREVQEQTIPSVINQIDQWFDERRQQDERFAGINTEFIERRLTAMGEQLGNLLGAEALPLLLSTFSFAIELFIYLVSSFYLIVYGDKIFQAIRDILNRRYHREFDRLVLDVNATLGAYLRGQVILFVIMSSASYVALRILDVNYALTVAIATGFLELIPLIGPWTAGAIAVSIALFQSTAPFGWSNLTLAIVVGFVYFALRQLEDVFVIPNVIGRIVHLHPLLVIFVLVIGTSLGGVLGLLLAVPVAAVLKIILSFFYAKLMARETRHIETIGHRDDLLRLEERFPDLVNATIVLLIEPDVFGWDDVGLLQRLAEQALNHAIALSAVAPDGIAGALATAAGIPTTTVPLALPATREPALSTSP